MGKVKRQKERGVGKEDRLKTLDTSFPRPLLSGTWKKREIDSGLRLMFFKNRAIPLHSFTSPDLLDFGKLREAKSPLL